MGKNPNKFKPKDDPNFKVEVAAFASQLGLASTGPGEAFGFSDFAPGAAQKPLAKANREKGRVRDKSRGRGSADRAEGGAGPREGGYQGASAAGGRGGRGFGGRGGRGEEGGRGRSRGGRGTGRFGPDSTADYKPGQSTDEATETSKKGRAWNEGAGLRPVPGRFLKGEDEDEDAPTDTWHSLLDQLLPGHLSDSAPLDAAKAAAIVESARTRGDELLTRETESYEKGLASRSSRDSTWLQTVRKAGTVSDKIAAAALLVEDAPAANLASLDSLLNHVAKGGKGGNRVAVQAMEAVQELFIRVLLPDRKLRFLEQSAPALASLPPGKAGDRALMLLTLEDRIKSRFVAFVEALKMCSTDNLEYVKDRAMKTAYELLAKKPEQEAALLSLLVNKLGDPSRKVASRTGYLVLCLLTEHPAMGMVVVREVEKFVYRPNVGERSRYYAAVFLNQIVLSHKEPGPQVAKRLVDLYFTLFRLAAEGGAGGLGKGKEEDGDGVRESIREDEGSDGDGEGEGRRDSHKRAGGKGKKKAPTPGSIQHAREADARMLSALLTGVNRAMPFVAADEVEALSARHEDDLFRLAHSGSLAAAVQALALLYQVSSRRQAVSDRLYRALYAVLLEEGLPRSTRLPMFLSLLFKALKQDTSAKRVTAFAKRILQVATTQGASFACGALLLVSELARTHKSLWSSVQQPEDGGDDVERFEDQDDEEGAGAGAEGGKKEEGRRGEDAWPGKGRYDHKAREPLYAGAERACMWELTALSQHAHPAVAAFSKTMLQAQHVSYGGDPLKDMSFSVFLDKFLLKKPKAAIRGSSIMQRVSGSDASAAAVGSDAFAALAEAEVRPEDLYFHKYFTSDSVLAKREAAKARKGDMADGDADIDDDEADEFLDKIEGGVAGEVGSDGEYDYDALGDALGAGSDSEGTDIEEDLSDIDEGDVSDTPTDEDEPLIQPGSDGLLRIGGDAGSDSEEEEGGSEGEQEEEEEGSDGADGGSSGDEGEEEEEEGPSGSDDDGDADLDEDDLDALMAGGSDSDADNEAAEEEAATRGKKRRGAEASEPVRDRKRSKKSRDALPEFASVDDYMAMIDADERGEEVPKKGKAVGGSGGGLGNGDREERGRGGMGGRGGRGEGRGGRGFGGRGGGRGGGGRGGSGRGRGGQGRGRGRGGGGRGRR